MRTFLCYAVFFPLVILTHPFVMLYEWATGTGGEYEWVRQPRKRFLLLLLLPLFFLPGLAHGAIAFDNCTSSSSSSSSTLKIPSFTITGSNVVGVVGVQTYAGVGSGRTITGITWNGSAMTAAVPNYPLLNQAGADSYYGLYWIANPTEGQVVATFSGAALFAWGDAATYTGAHQTSQAEATSTASSTSVTVTSITDNAWAVGFFGANDGNTRSAGANTVLRCTNATRFEGDSNQAITPPGNWTLNQTTNSTKPVTIAMVLVPAAAAGGNTPNWPDPFVIIISKYYDDVIRAKVEHPKLV